MTAAFGLLQICNLQTCDGGLAQKKSHNQVTTFDILSYAFADVKAPSRMNFTLDYLIPT